MRNLVNFQDRIKKPMLILSQPNLYYLTGFTGSSGMLIVTKKSAYFATDPRYIAVARTQLSRGVELVILPKEDKFALRDYLVKKKIKTLDFESGRVTVGDLEYLKKMFSSKIKLSPAQVSVEDLRANKSQAELKLMRRAGKITCKVFAKIKKKIKLGMTEKNLAWELEKLARECGADELAFGSIVAFGENTAIPHHQLSERKLRRGDAIQLDFGVEVQGYKSDCSRVLFAGEPSEKIKAIYQHVLAIQTEAMGEVHAGQSASYLAKKYESYTFPIHGEKLVSHGLGHGVGLEIHELPNLKPKSEDCLLANQIVTIEPGRYHEGIGGVRIEDTVLVHQKTCESLTPAPKTLQSAILKI